ncbi:MAG: GNAT family N-acetyltransferase [Acidimicrobiales bacterium]
MHAKTDTPHGVPPHYRLELGPPAPDDYLTLRASSGLSPRRPDQAVAALGGEWAAIHVVHEPSGSTVGMGRVIGDGGWYFHVLDMAVLPEHQQRGLGDAMVSAPIGFSAPIGTARRLRRVSPNGTAMRSHARPAIEVDTVPLNLPVVMSAEVEVAGAQILNHFE